MKWLQIFEQKAQQHHDLWAAAGVHYMGADISLLLGDLQKAEEYAYRALETAERVGDKIGIAMSHYRIDTIALCQGSWKQATDAFQTTSQLCGELGSLESCGTRSVNERITLALGQVYLTNGKRQEAVKQFERVMTLAKPDDSVLVDALSRLEEAYDDPEAFRAFCHRFREEHPEIGDSPFVQWFLEMAETREFSETLFHDEFAESLSSSWVWQDPFDDCSFTVHSDLQLHAANGRELWHTNLSAPRILQPVSGDFSVQTICVPVSRGKPAIGGILLWKDKENFLRLDKGTRGTDEVSFMGCLGNEDVFIGRGHLACERAFLRLERLGGRVNALCSADGVNWYTAGSAGFLVENPVKVGVCAIGAIDRTIYHGAYPEGTAIRFESFQLRGR
ncbi:MAG: hypothetical protein ACE5JP_09570 [Candidatus Bipolaricaulia bacterium]